MKQKELEVLKDRLDLLEKLRRQISVYFGRKDGGLATLQDGYHLLKSGDPFFCECCGRNLRDENHKDDCEIPEYYLEAFGLANKKSDWR